MRHLFQIGYINLDCLEIKTKKNHCSMRFITLQLLEEYKTAKALVKFNYLDIFRLHIYFNSIIFIKRCCLFCGKTNVSVALEVALLIVVLSKSFHQNATTMIIDIRQ